MGEPTAPASWPTGIQEVAAGVYAFVQAGGGFCVANAGLIVGDESAILVDTLFVPSMTRALIEGIRRVTDKPVRTIINSHHHVDHTLGNALFPDAVIISQARARARIEAGGVPTRLKTLAPQFAEEIDEVEMVRLPSVTFERELTLHSGGRKVELYHFGVGHTADDVVVHLPADDIVFAGDLAFHYVTPLAFEGDIENWIRVTRMVAELGPAVVVPGHGPIGDLSDLAHMRAYLERVLAFAAEAHAAGRPAEGAAAAMDLGPYGTWTEPERVVPNIMRMYQALDGALDRDLDPHWGEAMAAWAERHAARLA